jgi:hypothetical protein
MRFSSCALAATLLLGSSAAFAQNSAPLRWTEGAPNATSDMNNDTKIEGLKTDDVNVYAGISDVKETEYNKVWIQVANHGKSPIDFDPQTAILINEKDKTVRPEAADKASHSIQKFGEAKSQELSSAHCPNMIATGCQPTVTQMQAAKQVSAFSAQQAAWVKDNGVDHKTIAPGAELKGYIFFKKDSRKKENYVLKVPVASQVFEFPVTADNKAPAYE